MKTMGIAFFLLLKVALFFKATLRNNVRNLYTKDSEEKRNLDGWDLLRIFIVVCYFTSVMPRLQTAYILTFAFTLFAFSGVGLCQVDKTSYSSYRRTSDSIIKLYYGSQLLKYISFDSTESYYRTLKTAGSGTYTKFTEPLEFEPEMFVFHYYFKHPNFHGDTLNIEFYVDKNHRIMEGFSPEGLFDMKGKTQLQIISKKKALEIAKKAKIKRPQKNYEIEFGWYEQEATTEDYKKFNKTKDIKQIVKGRIVWKVTSKFRNAPEWDEKPYAQTYIIDAVTGIVIGIEQAFIDWG